MPPSVPERVTQEGGDHEGVQSFLRVLVVPSSTHSGGDSSPYPSSGQPAHERTSTYTSGAPPSASPFATVAEWMHASATMA
jgi:hypothetical protein